MVLITGDRGAAYGNRRRRSYFTCALVCVVSLAFGAAATFFILHSTGRHAAVVSNTDIRDTARRLEVLCPVGVALAM